MLPGLTKTERLESVLQKWAKDAKKTLEDIIEEKSKDIPLKRLG